MPLAKAAFRPMWFTLISSAQIFIKEVIATCTKRRYGRRYDFIFDPTFHAMSQLATLSDEPASLSHATCDRYRLLLQHSWVRSGCQVRHAGSAALTQHPIQADDCGKAVHTFSSCLISCTNQFRLKLLIAHVFSRSTRYI